MNEQETNQNVSNYPKFPHIEVQLTGNDGNAFAIIGAVTKAMRRGGVSANDIKAYQSEAMSGDYDNLLATSMRYVDVH